MEFSQGAWWIVTCLSSVVVAVIGFFLRRTVGKTDEHDKDINHIKQTYVTKEELTSVKEELRKDLAVMQQDLKDIKDNSLQKKDYFRMQTSMDNKIDRIYDLIIGGGTRKNG